MDPTFAIKALLVWTLCGMSLSVAAQVKGLHKPGKMVPYKSGYIVYNWVDTSLIPIDTFYPPLVKLVPNGLGGLKAVYLDDTLPTATILNKKLDTISAAFYPISDSLHTFPDSHKPGSYFLGSLRDSLSEKNNLRISYFIRPNGYSGSVFEPLMCETRQLLSLADSANRSMRDSIIDDEYKRYIASKVALNELSTGDSCLSKRGAIVHAGYDKSILNADSMIIIQYIGYPYRTCAIGLRKDVVLYKKGLGYIVLGYGLSTVWDKPVTIPEASDLLDELIQQTWGIIRFNKE